MVQFLYNLFIDETSFRILLNQKKVGSIFSLFGPMLPDSFFLNRLISGNSGNLLK